MNNEQFEELEARAAGLGKEHGRNAASWVFDGNTKLETYKAVLKGMEDGDPIVMDGLRPPDLSGETADGFTPTLLYAELGTTADEDSDDMAFCRAYEDAASEAFYDAVEFFAREALKP